MASSTTIIKPSINSNPTHSLPITSILSITEMSYQPHIQSHQIPIPKSLLNPASHLPNITTNTPSEGKLTLIAALRNSLINKDTDSFLFCLEQTDQVLITSTIKGLDETTIKMFIEKLIDLFQRSTVYKLSLISWMKMILKCHHFALLSMEKEVIENLMKVKDLIVNYTKNYEKLRGVERKLRMIKESEERKEEEVKGKGKGKGKAGSAKGKSDNAGSVEPLLVYEESDDEEDVRRKEKKMKMMEENDIKPYDEEEEEDDDDNKMDIEPEDDDDNEDYFDIEGNDDNEGEDNNPFKKTIKKNKEEDNASMSQEGDHEGNESA